MSQRLAVTQHTPAARKAPSVALVVRPAVRVDAAPADQKETSEFTIFGDPLWGIAIATVILFATLAALIAFS